VHLRSEAIAPPARRQRLLAPPCGPRGVPSGAGVAIRNRFEEQRGQTAAEYMGILLVVAVIIGALIAADVDGKIAKAASDMVDKIAGGNEKR
jgi:hypothetical protein